MYAYHVYAEYPSYKHPGTPSSINTVMQVQEKILNPDQYGDLKYAIVKKYDLEVDRYSVVIKSLSYLGPVEGES